MVGRNAWLEWVKEKIGGAELENMSTDNSGLAVKRRRENGVVAKGRCVESRKVRAGCVDVKVEGSTVSLCTDESDPVGRENLIFE